jgi:hypothetical protein
MEWVQVRPAQFEAIARGLSPDARAAWALIWARSASGLPIRRRLAWRALGIESEAKWQELLQEMEFLLAGDDEHLICEFGHGLYVEADSYLAARIDDGKRGAEARWGNTGTAKPRASKKPSGEGEP